MKKITSIISGADCFDRTMSGTNLYNKRTVRAGKRYRVIKVNYKPRIISSFTIIADNGKTIEIPKNLCHDES